MDNRRPGDWDCPSCSQMNFASRIKCFKCGVAKPDAGGIIQNAPTQPLQYVMPPGQYPVYNQKQGGYGYFNKNKNIKEGDWFCQCSAHNYAFRNDCFRCQKPKSESENQQRGGGGPQPFFAQPQNTHKPGDWFCTSEGCNFHNFANRDKCFKCGAPKAQQAVFQ